MRQHHLQTERIEQVERSESEEGEETEGLFCGWNPSLSSSYKAAPTSSGFHDDEL